MYSIDVAGFFEIVWDHAIANRWKGVDTYVRTWYPDHL